MGPSNRVDRGIASTRIPSSRRRPRKPPPKEALSNLRSKLLKGLGGLERLAKILAAVWILAISTGVLLSLMRSSYSTEMVVQSMATSRELLDAGYSGAILAAQLSENLLQVETDTASVLQPDAFSPGAYSASRADSIVVPGAGISLEQVRWFILKMTGRSPVQIEATVVTDEDAGMRLAVSCSECRPRFFWVVPDPSSAGDVDALLHHGAIEIYRRLRPYRTALYFYRQGNDEACRRAIDACFLNESPEDDAWASNLAGLLAMRQGDFDQAERWFGRAVRLEPDLAVSFKNWGRMEHARGNHDVAKEKFRQALSLDPESASTCYAIARLAQEEGDFAEAEAYFERSHRLNPARVATVYNWAVAAWQQRRWSDALDRIELANRVAKSSNLQVLSTWARWLRKLGEEAERRDQRDLARWSFGRSAEKLEEILDRDLVSGEEASAVRATLAHLHRRLGREPQVQGGAAARFGPLPSGGD